MSLVEPECRRSDEATMSAPSRPTMFDAALKIGLVALLVYACSRIIVPLFDVLLWSAILAVMLYPLHLRLRVRLGNRWSALLIGLVGIAVMVVAMAIVVTSLGSSIYSLISGLKNQSLTVPPPPPRPRPWPRRRSPARARPRRPSGRPCRRTADRSPAAERAAGAEPARRRVFGKKTHWRKALASARSVTVVISSFVGSTIRTVHGSPQAAALPR